MDDKKEVKIHFAPGCFDNFEGTQEELDQLVQSIRHMVDSGELFEMAQPLSEVDLSSLPESLQKEILRELDDPLAEPPPSRTLQ